MATNYKIDAMSISTEIIKQKHHEARVPAYWTKSPEVLLQEVMHLVREDRLKMVDSKFREKYVNYIKKLRK